MHLQPGRLIRLPRFRAPRRLIVAPIAYPVNLRAASHSLINSCRVSPDASHPIPGTALIILPAPSSTGASCTAAKQRQRAKEGEDHSPHHPQPAQACLSFRLQQVFLSGPWLNHSSNRRFPHLTFSHSLSLSPRSLPLALSLLQSISISPLIIRVTIFIRQSDRTGSALISPICRA